VLEQMGFEVHTAMNGAKAKELIGSLPPPAIATLDIKLPDTSGVDLIILIKSTPGWERVPIVMVTGTPKDDNVTGRSSPAPRPTSSSRSSRRSCATSSSASLRRAKPRTSRRFRSLGW
jgi:CheY-like chemotaxis protein